MAMSDDERRAHKNRLKREARLRRASGSELMGPKRGRPKLTPEEQAKSRERRREYEREYQRKRYHELKANDPVEFRKREERHNELRRNDPARRARNNELRRTPAYRKCRREYTRRYLATKRTAAQYAAFVELMNREQIELEAEASRTGVDISILIEQRLNQE
jgi:hypothetical protein